MMTSLLSTGHRLPACRTTTSTSISTSTSTTATTPAHAATTVATPALTKYTCLPRGLRHQHVRRRNVDTLSRTLRKGRQSETKGGQQGTTDLVLRRENLCPSLQQRRMQRWPALLAAVLLLLLPPAEQTLPRRRQERRTARQCLQALLWPRSSSSRANSF